MDSGKNPTLASQINPLGLQRNQLAWLSNASVRAGGIQPRLGWNYLCTVHDDSELYQGGLMYQPDASYPYLMLSIGGRMYQVRVDSDNSVHDVTGGFADPASVPQAFFVQAEQFMVKQTGDGVTLPLFWDGVSLRRSVGIIGPNNIPANEAYPQDLPFNEIPAATCMDYYMGRLWYAQGRQYCAGDIVDNTASGTIAYEFRDSVLKVTESPLAAGGDGFIIPANDTNIRAIAHTNELNASLGQGNLYVFTRKNVYALQVPVTRAEWIATTANTQPQQTVALRGFGASGDRSVVPVNGDLYYQTVEPGIRSLALGVRDFDMWSNTPLSRNEVRLMQYNDPALLSYASGIEFDNRLWQTAAPLQTAVGVAHQAVAPLDFDIISSFLDKINATNLPAWEGQYEGLLILQLFTGDFGGIQRLFGVVYSQINSAIEVWEMTGNQATDNSLNGQESISWYAEFPAFTWGKEFQLKELCGGEIWVDQIFGQVNFELYYRNDQNPCWKLWCAWSECAAEDCSQDANNPCAYPLGPYKTQFRATRQFPVPPVSCDLQNSRPSTLGYQFQPLLRIVGQARVRGLLLYATNKDRAPYQFLVPNCKTTV